LADGLYTVDSMNKFALSGLLNGWYYLLAPSSTGDSLLFYEFLSTADRTNFVNYNTYNVRNLSKGNKGIYDGSIWLNSIFLKSDLFHVHTNEYNTQSPSLITNNTIEIPIAVDPC